jgi:2-dehydropantoate 2-reductase
VRFIHIDGSPVEFKLSYNEATTFYYLYHILLFMLSPDDKPRVLVLGTGAIGGFYGHILSRAKAHVTVVARSDYGIVKNHGIEISSQSLGNAVFIPHETIPSILVYQGKHPDYLIVGLKVVPGVNRIELMRPAIGPGTVIVLIENGVEIEQEIHEAFPNNQIISCLAFVQVNRVAPGKLMHFAGGELTMGNFPSGVSDACKELTRLFELGGISIVLNERITQGRWQKLLWNGAFNPVSVLGDVVNTHDLLNVPGGEELIRELMAEIMAIAKATGNEIPAPTPDHFIAFTRKAPAYKTSMAIDWERKQDLEVDVILDNAILAANRESVSVPRLKQVQTLIKMMQDQRSKQQI